MGKPQLVLEFPEKSLFETGQELGIRPVDTCPTLLLFVATHS